MKSQNPAHWLMKLGALFEISHCEHTGAKYHKTMFKSDIGLPMNNLYMHQCPNATSTKWEWGMGIFKIVENALLDEGLLDKHYVKTLYD